jgi:uncharacterized C2H2 Zn-finger protein
MSDWSIGQVTKTPIIMIITKDDGTKVSSENTNFSGKIIAKCPKCECVYFQMQDFKSFWNETNRGFVCNECGTNLEDQILK